MKVIVTRAHRSSYPEPVSFAEGDRIRVGREDTEFPGWVWITDSTDREGWAPLDYLQINNTDGEAIALANYDATELNTVEGEELHVHQELNQWYRAENARGGCGWVPVNTTVPRQDK
ncbi:MAG: SH3 domain-containing protein [Gammaproteobacteria bacterium]|nr:SH3 domain-containing protein [Gammaproteobacteria bacterium]